MDNAAVTIGESVEIDVQGLKFSWRFQTLHWHADPAHKWTDDEQFNDHRAAGLYDDYGNGGEWFGFYFEDCMQPPVYIIRARTFEDAYEAFVEEFGDIVDEVDLKDYDKDDPRLTWTDRGPVDTASVMGHELTLTSAIA